jgi:hypothetical protein
MEMMSHFFLHKKKYRAHKKNVILFQITKNMKKVKYPARLYGPTEKIDVGTSKLLPKHIEELETLGYTIIPDVVSCELCELTKTRFRGFMCGLGTGITNDALQTGTITQDQLPYNLHGILTYPRMVGEEVMAVRFSPEVANVFSSLWGVPPSDLITSEDRSNYMPAAPMNKREQIKSQIDLYRWLHVDQCSKLQGLQCVQGLVTLTNVSDDGGTLVVVPKSHLHHKEIVAKAEGESSGKKSLVNFVRISKNIIDSFGLAPIAVRPATAGSMLLWDSRLIHCNIPTADDERMVVYTCQVPRSWFIPSQLKRRQETFFTSRTTSHWPHFVKKTGIKPHLYGGTVKSYPDKYVDEKSLVEQHLAAFKSVREANPEYSIQMINIAGFDSERDFKEKLEQFKKKPPPQKKRKNVDGEESQKKKRKTIVKD